MCDVPIIIIIIIIIIINQSRSWHSVYVLHPVTFIACNFV
jgi:hypothetical protein